MMALGVSPDTLHRFATDPISVSFIQAFGHSFQLGG